MSTLVCLLSFFSLFSVCKYIWSCSPAVNSLPLGSHCSPNQRQTHSVVHIFLPYFSPFQTSLLWLTLMPVFLSYWFLLNSSIYISCISHTVVTLSGTLSLLTILNFQTLSFSFLSAQQLISLAYNFEVSFMLPESSYAELVASCSDVNHPVAYGFYKVSFKDLT